MIGPGQSMQLNGMKEICHHVGFSESTVLIWIKTKGFPAVKVTGSWISDTEDIREWRRKLLKNDPMSSRKTRKNP